MNTIFKILWFEDEQTWYKMEKLHVEGILNTHYLIPEIIRKNGDDFNIDELTGNDFDLILMDFKLANEVTGDTIVAALRESSILTDILFYSSEEDAMLDAIRTKMPPIDGVYLTKRDYTIFTEKVRKVIEKIVKRSEDIVNLRGFVLDNTSDFELRIKEILNLCWQKFDETQKSSLTEVLLKLLDRKKAWVANQVEAAKSAPSIFESANNDKYLLSISDRLDIFQAILPILSTTYGFPATACPSNFKQYYIDKVNVYRNKLGHITLGEKTIRIKEKETEINQELHRTLRKNIAEVDSKICSIEEHLTTNM